ncbi:hypothetical protein VPHK460_0103 [Vibrio phage K460]
MVTQERINIRAEGLYYRRMRLCPMSYDFMWSQCSEDYQNAWKAIARIELEDEYMVDAAIQADQEQFNMGDL